MENDAIQGKVEKSSWRVFFNLVLSYIDNQVFLQLYWETSVKLYLKLNECSQIMLFYAPIQDNFKRDVQKTTFYRKKYNFYQVYFQINLNAPSFKQAKTQNDINSIFRSSNKTQENNFGSDS